MPLSGKGESALAGFVRQYGAKRGKRIFFKKENSDPKFARMVKKK